MNLYGVKNPTLSVKLEVGRTFIFLQNFTLINLSSIILYMKKRILEARIIVNYTEFQLVPLISKTHFI